MDHCRPDPRLDHGKNHEGLRVRSPYDIVIGIVGALIGGFLMRLLGLAGECGMIYTIIVAVIGAVILAQVVRMVKKA